MASHPSGFLIDCAPEVFDEGVRFWSQAFGVVPHPADDADGTYVALPGAHESMDVEVQRLADGPSRFHLDLAADDVDEEADRLEGLGATKLERVEDWWVMRAPTGHIFCVVPDE